MNFETEVGRAEIFESQQSLFHVRFEIDADRFHVANDLILRFFESEEERALATFAGRFHEVCGNRALAGTGCAGDEDRAAAIETFAAQHRVESRITTRDPLRRRLVVESD